MISISNGSLCKNGGMEKEEKYIYNNELMTLSQAYAKVYEDFCVKAEEGGYCFDGNPLRDEFVRISDLLMSSRLLSQGYEAERDLLWEGLQDAPELICRAYMEDHGYRYDSASDRFLQDLSDQKEQQ